MNVLPNQSKQKLRIQSFPYSKGVSVTNVCEWEVGKVSQVSRETGRSQRKAVEESQICSPGSFWDVDGEELR